MKRTNKEKIYAARSKIKTHLKQRGTKCDFEICEGLVRYWWNVLNNAVFDGILHPPAKFEFREFRDSFGWCAPWRPNSKERRVRIGISTDLWERKMFLSVLVHEMVHVYEHQVHGKMSHGKTFYEWAPKVKYRTGLPLAEHIDFE